jgi:hypothetical protein
MGVITPTPPAARIVQVRKKPRSNIVHTIHDYSHNPFMFRTDDTKHELQSTILSFRREADALKLSQLIEIHKAMTKTYPLMTMEGLPSLFVNTGMMVDSYESGNLYLKTWEFESLREYCAAHMLNLFVMNTMTLNSNDVYTLKGKHLLMSLPYEKYADILNGIYEVQISDNNIYDIPDE